MLHQLKHLNSLYTRKLQQKLVKECLRPVSRLGFRCFSSIKRFMQETEREDGDPPPLSNCQKKPKNYSHPHFCLAETLESATLDKLTPVMALCHYFILILTSITT